jgi:hypothetical protein
MEDSKRSDLMMRGIVLASAFSFLEAMRLWGDGRRHWHGLGILDSVADFFALPLVILLSLLQIFRAQRGREVTK